MIRYARVDVKSEKAECIDFCTSVPVLTCLYSTEAGLGCDVPLSRLFIPSTVMTRFTWS